jgi:hypothetical protein
MGKKKFDATLKDLGSEYPRDFLLTFDQATMRPVKLNVDLSTITTSADIVLGLGDPLEEIVHIDFQSTAMKTKHVDIAAYNVLLYRTYLVPVHSIVILLRPAAAHSNLNGTVSYNARPGRGSMIFTYELVRVWERPVEEFLAGALGTLPLAVLGKVPEGVDVVEGLSSVVQRMTQRLDAGATAEQRRYLMTASYLLAGLRFRPNVCKQLFAGVIDMHESETYQAVMDEGQEKHAKAVILSLGKAKFGVPDPATMTRIEGANDLQWLDRVIARVLKATSWEDLLDTP